MITELKDWLNDNWDPGVTVAEWWQRLGLAGWSAPALPKNAYGRELSRADSVRVQQTIADHGALGAPGGLGLLLFRQMAMSNYGGIATVILAVLALIVFGEVVSYYARRAVI